MNKVVATFRLFKYVDARSALFFLKEKLCGNDVIPITLKDETHAHALSAPLLNFLRYKTGVVAHNLFSWEMGGERWVASYEQVVGLAEYVNRMTHTFYAAHYENKTVLDIGGFVGDTARFFLNEGAKRVVIIEPSRKNIDAMSFNLQDYRDSVTIHQKALSHSDEMVCLYSSELEGSSSFGSRRGVHQLTCQGITIDTILAQSQFDIAKVDCEGGERHLLSADPKVLQKVNYWMIETHDEEMQQKMICKFHLCGFKKLKQFSVAKGVDVIHFSC